ncbi:MAG: WD40 repeat domain-containing protein, partial [Hyphomicrobiales bacterium]
MSLKRAHGLKRPHGLERPQGRALGLVLMVAAFLLLAGLGQGHAAGAPVAITPTVGHDAAAGTLAISGDGRFAASAGSENGVKFWSLSNGRLIRTFIGHTRSVQALAFAPGGRYLASGGGDGSIRFWEIETGAEAARIDIPDDLVNALAFSADGRLLVAGTRDRLAVVWDVASGRRLAEVKGDGDQALAVAISGDGRSALSIGYGATLSIIDIRKGRVARTVKIAGNGAFSLAFSADGSRLAVAEPEGVTNIWDGTTGRRLVAFAEDAGVVSRIAISADGRTVVTTGTGGFRIWSADTGRPLASVAEAGRQFFAVALSADGKLVLTSDNLDPGDAPGSAWMASGRLALWNGDGGKPLRRLAGTSTSIYSLAVSPDGTRFATGHVAGDVQSWNLAAARLSAPVAASADIVHGLGFAADGMIVSVAGSAIGFFDPETGAELATLPLKGMVKLRGAAFSSDGTRAIVASEPVDEMEAGPEERERTVIVDLLKRKIVRDLGDAGMGVSALAFAPDAGIAVIASYGEIRLVDAARGRVARTLPLKDGVVDAIAISPDGRLLAVGSQTEAQLLDTRKGRVLRQFQGLGDVVERLVFSPDGTRLAAASYDGSALLWNVGTGELAARLEGHAAPVFDVAFTPDGRRLLTAGWDTMTRIWDVASGKTLASFIAFSEANWVSITPFGFFDASGHGAEMLNVVRGLEVLPIDRVFQALYRPDLVHEALAGDP